MALLRAPGGARIAAVAVLAMAEGLAAELITEPDAYPLERVVAFAKRALKLLAA